MLLAMPGRLRSRGPNKLKLITSAIVSGLLSASGNGVPTPSYRRLWSRRGCDYEDVARGITDALEKPCQKAILSLALSSFSATWDRAAMDGVPTPYGRTSAPL